ncbi:MAG: hypothetical protein HQ464_09220 [Planctomycetes bacterium]|nr:hypothetical protein [Planctomycetota bacterium]
MRSQLWALTSYFNPTGSHRRRANYEVFRRQLKVPLVAVELASDRPFELGSHDAEILVQIRCRSVMWQKERLLNIALRHVPHGVSAIAWVDCDVIFANANWVDEAAVALQHSVLVQPFDSVWNVRKEASLAARIDRTQTEPGGTTFVSRFARQKISRESFFARGPSRVRNLLGYAWVARCSLLDTHGFYDASIVGGGDRDMAMAAYGFFDETIEIQQKNASSAAHYARWARPFHQAVAGGVRALSGEIYHLWHGDLTGRQYFERFAHLQALGFDPETDIAISPQGAWEWATEKPEVHAYLRDYFYSRREDG